MIEMRYVAVVLLMALAACSERPADSVAPASSVINIGEAASEEALPEAEMPMPPPSPFAKTVSGDKISPLYRQEWQKAANRDTCAIIALPDNAVSQHAGVTARRAEFAGGWGVVYDLPDLRSAYGVAGTGVVAGDAENGYQWPNQLQWDDGSSAGFGLEGGQGPNYLASLQVAGQQCLYNVWSGISEEHLEQMLNDLRRLNDAP